MYTIIIVVIALLGFWFVWEISFGPVRNRRRLEKERCRLKTRLKEVRKEISRLHSAQRRQWSYALKKELWALQVEEEKLMDRQKEVKIWIRAA